MKRLVNKNKNYPLLFESIKAFCFPIFYKIRISKSKIKRLLFKCILKEEQKKLDDFYIFLSQLKKEVNEDASSYLKYDPASYNLKEIVFAYPGFLATLVYRVANYLGKKKMIITARLFSEWAHEKTGVDIHYNATIGVPFFIDHGTGVVIGATSIIKNNVRIYQGVTLGALSIKSSLKDKKRHPTINEDVTIYAYATILGGETIIGDHSIIGTNVLIKESVPSYSIAIQESKEKRYRLIKRKR